MDTYVAKDLVVFALPGIQRFIAESRTTRDLAHSSLIIQDLARVAVSVVTTGGAQLVLPSDPAGAVSNKVVFQADAGTGEDLARQCADEVRDYWASRVNQLCGPGAALPKNFPVITWVCIKAPGRTYEEQWSLAQHCLAGRRRVRDFAVLCEPSGSRVCAATGRWTALSSAPRDTPAHERSEALSAVAWVKRHWSSAQVPATATMATVPYRSWIVEHLVATADRSDPVSQAVEALRGHAVRSNILARGWPLPGAAPANSGGPAAADIAWISRAGDWVQQEAWHAAAVRDAWGGASTLGGHQDETVAATGRRLAAELAGVVGKAGGPAPSRYLALVATDLDSLGRTLSGAIIEPGPLGVTAAWQKKLSGRMTELARHQRALIEDHTYGGYVVYAGGDDLLALVPAARALQVAKESNQLVEADTALPSASTAVHLFHQNSNLSEAVGSVHRLLVSAKAAGHAKHGLAVGFERRSGNVCQIARPWKGVGDTSCIDLLEDLRATEGVQVTPGLLAQVLRDQSELSILSHLPDQQYYLAEVRRLVGRHLGDASPGAVERWAQALVEVARRRDGDPDLFAALRVGIFLRQECQ